MDNTVQNYRCSCLSAAFLERHKDSVQHVNLYVMIACSIFTLIGLYTFLNAAGVIHTGFKNNFFGRICASATPTQAAFMLAIPILVNLSLYCAMKKQYGRVLPWCLSWHTGIYC